MYSARLAGLCNLTMMSATIAESTLCCARCLRTQAGSSARTVTTLASRKSHRRRQSSSTAQEVPAAHVSSQRTPLPARRRSFATARQVRKASSTAPASGTAPGRREPDSDVLSASPQQPPSAPVLAGSPSDALRQQLEDLRNLLLRITGTDEAHSTRLVAFPSYQGGQAEEKAWMDRLSRGIARLGKQRQRYTRVAGQSDTSDSDSMTDCVGPSSLGRLFRRSSTLQPGFAGRSLVKPYIAYSKLATTNTVIQARGVRGVRVYHPPQLELARRRQ